MMLTYKKIDYAWIYDILIIEYMKVLRVMYKANIIFHQVMTLVPKPIFPTNRQSKWYQRILFNSTLSEHLPSCR